MKTLTPVSICLLFGILMLTPAAFACLQCSAAQDCVSAESGASGNCECNIKLGPQGIHICKPVGICDPNDFNTCDDEGTPRQEFTTNKTISIPSGITRHVASKNTLLAGVLAASLDLGTMEGGTMTIPEGRFAGSWKFATEVEEGSRMISVTIRVENFADGRMLEFTGGFWNGGSDGRFDVRENGVALEQVEWANVLSR